MKLISGVGPYTAGAISSIAFNYPAPLVDGNVIRVIARWTAMAGDPKHKSSVDYFWKVAADLLVKDRPGDWNQALMDFGATVCTPATPDCLKCPVKSHCKAYLEETQFKGYKENLETDIEDCNLCQTCPLPADIVDSQRTVTFYPVKSPKKESKLLLSYLVIIECPSLDDDSSKEYLIFKRSEKGLLAGLWQFLELDHTEDSASSPEKLFVSFLKENYNFCKVEESDFEGFSLEVIGEFTHLFTHIKQEIILLHGRWTLPMRKHFDEVLLDSKFTGRVKWVSRLDFDTYSTCKSAQKAMAMFDNCGNRSGATAKKLKTEKSSAPPQKNNLLNYFKKPS